MVSPFKAPCFARRRPDLTALTFYPNRNRRALEIGNAAVFCPRVLQISSVVN
jgi:hypothetical protein